MRWSIVVSIVLGLMLAQGCNCDDTVARDDPMTIKFLSPTGTLITEGYVRGRVEDLNGIVNIKILVNGEEVLNKEGNDESKITVSANFDLEKMPDTFKIKIIAEDITQEKGEKTLEVRKDQGAPQIRFALPKKLDEKHKVIYVGKKFQAAAEARDRDGIAEIALSMVADGKTEETVRTCAIKGNADKWEKCESTLDLSADKYKDGNIILQATATDAKGKKPDRKTRLQVVLDKTGPTIQITSPGAGDRLKGGETFTALIRDIVGIKKVEMTVGGKQLQVKKGSKEDEYTATIDKSTLGGTNVELKVVAWDHLDNRSEKTLGTKGGCARDEDCDAGKRCCVTKSPANKDGSKIGQCYDVQTQEGALCDPCTNPCGKGTDNKLMGCLPGACERPPHRCRRACNLGNRNQRPDKCRAADPSANPPQPAEYCAPSDITRINSSLGSCAHGDNCNVLNQQTCPAGATPPYNNCCPQGFGCYPADDDANICIPEGSTQPQGQNCELHNCKGGRNCTKGYLCVVSVDPQGRPIGASRCEPMCQCDQLCQAGLPSRGACPAGKFCNPVRLTNGNVPLPVGVCVGL